MTHICSSKLTIIGSDNGLLPDRHQAIIWTNAGILLILSIGTNFSEILGNIHTFSFKKMHLKMSSVKWWPFFLSLNVLKVWDSPWCRPGTWDFSSPRSQVVPAGESQEIWGCPNSQVVPVPRIPGISYMSSLVPILSQVIPGPRLT